MMSLRNVAAFGLLGSSLVVGCFVSTDETEQPAGPKYTHPLLSDFCKAVAVADCSAAVLNACYGEAGDGVKDSCISARSQVARCNPEGLTYHPEKADPCVAKHGEIYGPDSKLTKEDLDALNEACLPVLNRGGLENAPCGQDFDCDTSRDLRCVKKAPTDEGGYCAVPVIVSGGAKCGLTNQQCDEGLFCDDHNHCIVMSGVGEDCSQAPCDSATNCTETATDVFACTAKIATGGACKLDTDCASGFCVNLFCLGTLDLTNNNAACADFRP